jgi:hypothetical protein
LGINDHDGVIASPIASAMTIAHRGHAVKMIAD